MKMNKNAKLMYLTDCYKLGHMNQYPENTSNVYSVWTARNTDYAKTEEGKVIHAGVKYFIDRLIEISSDFFSMDQNVFNKEVFMFQTHVENILGIEYNIDHWIKLYDLGYLPIEIKSVKEFEQYDVNTPLVTIENTHDDFFWLTNYLETYFSATVWQASTSATIAHEIYRTMEEEFRQTGSNLEMLPYCGHDFSFRGMSSEESAVISGISHLNYFRGSDTVPAIVKAFELYDIQGVSVPATEHSVMCAGGHDDELETYKRLLKIYPEGILSIVSDTWDYFNVLTNVLPTLHSKIIARDGKLVIRPDSGDPIKIICGDRTLKDSTSPEGKGSLQILWEIFGGTVNDAGYKVLNPKIGLIYGDGINSEKISLILGEMRSKGFAAENIVFGIGSYAYQYNTRDTYSFAFKATSVIIAGEQKNIIKNPKTDRKKKSLTGRFDGYQELKLVYTNGMELG